MADKITADFTEILDASEKGDIENITITAKEYEEQLGRKMPGGESYVLVFPEYAGSRNMGPMIYAKRGGKAPDYRYTNVEVAFNGQYVKFPKTTEFKIPGDAVSGNIIATAWPLLKDAKLQKSGLAERNTAARTVTDGILDVLKEAAEPPDVRSTVPVPLKPKMPEESPDKPKEPPPPAPISQTGRDKTSKREFAAMLADGKIDAGEFTAIRRTMGEALGNKGHAGASVFEGDQPLTLSLGVKNIGAVVMVRGNHIAFERNGTLVSFEDADMAKTLRTGTMQQKNALLPGILKEAEAGGRAKEAAEFNNPLSVLTVGSDAAKGDAGTIVFVKDDTVALMQDGKLKSFIHADLAKKLRDGDAAARQELLPTLAKEAADHGTNVTGVYGAGLTDVMEVIHQYSKPFAALPAVEPGRKR